MKTPVQSWGFSFEQTQKYLHVSEQQELASHPQWLKLGHYKKTFLGYRSPFRTGLFINDQGYQSPEQELRSTIQLLYSEANDYVAKNKEHPQCYYLARTQWLNRVLSVDPKDVVPCPEKNAWKNDLNTESVSLIFAAGDLSNASSIFGHIFLKLNNPVNEGQKDLLNYGIDYSAEADSSEGVFYALKGLFGFYPGQFSLLPFHQKILEYTNLEGRDIWEFKLSFTKEESEFLINHLLEMEKARAPYYFADDNCATQILRTLEVVRPELNVADHLKLFVVPIETVKVLERTPALVSEVNFKPSLRTQFDQKFKLLNSNQANYFPELIKSLKFDAGVSFSKEEKAQLLESAAAWLSLEAFRKKMNFDEQKYQLYLQRIELGQLNFKKNTQTSDSLNSGTSNNTLNGEAINNKLNSGEDRPVSPTKSHDSFAVILGFNNGGQILKIRSTFHELEQPHSGLIPHSHIEAISISVRKSEQLKQFIFDRFALIKIINLNPSTSLEKRMAWKASLEFLDRFRTDGEAGIGLSSALTENDELRFSSFLTARLWQNSYLDNNQIKDGNWSAIGPEILLSFHPHPKFGLSVDSTYFFVGNNSDFWRTQLRANVQVFPSIDLQLLHENFIKPSIFNSSETENRISFAYSTIF